MNDETNVDKELSEWFSIQGAQIVQSCSVRNIPVHLINDRERVSSFVLKFIADRTDIKSVSYSDSMTLYQTGVVGLAEKLRGQGLSVNHPLARTENGQYVVFADQGPGRMSLPYDGWKRRTEAFYDGLRQSLMADLLLCGANAITINGEILSVDGIGNRVSGMIFGPRHVLVVVGRNKIYPDEETAWKMIRNRTVQLNSLRHRNKHYMDANLPCLKLGYCTSCRAALCPCKNFVKVDGQSTSKAFPDPRIHVCLVNADLGL